MSSFFDHVEKRLDKKATDNFKIYDVIEWATNNDDALSLEVKIARQLNLVNEFNMRNIFLGKSYTKFDGGASPRPFYENQN